LGPGLVPPEPVVLLKEECDANPTLRRFPVAGRPAGFRGVRQQRQQQRWNGAAAVAAVVLVPAAAALGRIADAS
jgi:hypothetical protein